jgi:hypothetical protein
MASNHFDPSPDAFASQTNKNHQSMSSSEPCDEFEPSEYSIVCGRGRDSFNHVGNRRFRLLASMFIEKYSRANNKAAKSAIVSEIIEVIRKAGGIFCTHKRGAWFEVGDHQAREKVSCLLRDLLHTQYRSSAKVKIGRRTATRKTVTQEQDQNQLSDQKRVERVEDSDDSSTTSSCWGRSKDSLGFEYWLEDSADFFEIEVF